MHDFYFSATAMRGPITSLPIGEYLSTGCVSMNQQCRTNPCSNGQCFNGVLRHYCECAGTAFAGPRCSDCEYVLLFYKWIYDKLCNGG